MGLNGVVIVSANFYLCSRVNVQVVKDKHAACKADLGLSTVMDKWASEVLGFCMVKDK